MAKTELIRSSESESRGTKYTMTDTKIDNHLEIKSKNVVCDTCVLRFHSLVFDDLDF